MSTSHLLRILSVKGNHIKTGGFYYFYQKQYHDFKMQEKNSIVQNRNGKCFVLRFIRKYPD